MDTRASLTSWDLFLACLSFYALTAIMADLLFDLPPDIHTILHVADNALCVLFLGDFLWRLVSAPSKLSYLKWGWIDLAASIPSIDALRWGRVVSLARVFLILRALRSGRALLRVMRHDPGRAVVASTLLVTITVMFMAAILVLGVETAEKSNIKSGYDALWWALTTVTTVGYGDHFPVTPRGRLIGAILMIAGITLYATITAFCSAKIMEWKQKHEVEEVETLLSEVKQLRSEIREMRALLLKE